MPIGSVLATADTVFYSVSHFKTSLKTNTSQQRSMQISPFPSHTRVFHVLPVLLLSTVTTLKLRTFPELTPNAEYRFVARLSWLRRHSDLGLGGRRCRSTTLASARSWSSRSRLSEEAASRSQPAGHRVSRVTSGADGRSATSAEPSDRRVFTCRDRQMLIEIKGT